MTDSIHPNEIELKGRVLGYTANASINDFADGQHASYDATTIEILSPPHWKNTRLAIYHDEPAAESSPWRVPGTALCFTIEESLLSEGVQVFSGAARAVRTNERATSEEGS